MKGVRHIDDTPQRLREILEHLQARQSNTRQANSAADRKAGRALSLAITRLEESLMWLKEAEG